MPAPEVTEVALIGPKLPPLMAQIDLGGALAQRLLYYLLGDDAKDLANVEELHLGSGAFQERFSIVTSSPDLARQLVNDAVEHELLDWMTRHPGHPPVVFRWRDRLEIRMAWKGLSVVDDVVELAHALHSGSTP